MALPGLASGDGESEGEAGEFDYGQAEGGVEEEVSVLANHVGVEVGAVDDEVGQVAKQERRGH